MKQSSSNLGSAKMLSPIKGQATAAGIAQALKFRVGDICITQNSRYPEVNDGVIVVVTRVDPGRTDRTGQVTPYWIERTDGLPLSLVNDARTGEPVWFRFKAAVCAESRLRKIRPDEMRERVQQGKPRLAVKNVKAASTADSHPGSVSQGWSRDQYASTENSK